MWNRCVRFRILVPLLAVALVAGWLFMHREHGADTGAAGQAAASVSGRSPLGEETIMQRFAPKHCSDQCPTVTVHTLRFDRAPKLSQILRQRLLGMAQLDGDRKAEQPADFQAFAQRLFKESTAMRHQHPEIAPYTAQFDAKVVS